MAMRAVARSPWRAVLRRIRHTSTLKPRVICLGLALLLISMLYTTASPCRGHSRLAFSIQASATSAVRVPRLMSALYDECNIYAIHFDSNMPYLERFALSKILLKRYPHNVHIVPSRPVTYAGVSMLLATLDALSLLLAERKSTPWHFFINLSASDYPLLAPRTIRKLLSEPSMRGLSLFQRQEATKSNAWFFNRRFATVHLDPALWGARGELSRAPSAVHIHARPDGLPLRKAEGWVLLWHEFAAHTVDSPDARTLLAVFANSRAPDEHYFATLHMLSETRFKVGWDAMRYIAWRNGSQLLARPAFLDDKQAGALRAPLFASGAMFARKFSGDGSEGMLDYIDAAMAGVGPKAYASQEIQASAEEHVIRVRRRLRCVAAFPNASGIDYNLCINGA